MGAAASMEPEAVVVSNSSHTLRERERERDSRFNVQRRK